MCDSDVKMSEDIGKRAAENTCLGGAGEEIERKQAQLEAVQDCREMN